MEVAKIEFGTHGYKAASTNAIYPRAKVSKGLIFKLFKSKAGLFYAVFETALADMLEEMHKFDLGSYDDVFEKIVQITLWKFEYSHRHPYDTKILLEGVGNPPKGLEAKIASHLHELMQFSVRYFFDSLPMDEISSEYTKSDVINYLEIGIAGLQARYVNRELTVEYMDSIRDESIRFLKTLLRGMEKK